MHRLPGKGNDTKANRAWAGLRARLDEAGCERVLRSAAQQIGCPQRVKLVSARKKVLPREHDTKIVSLARAFRAMCGTAC